jgi:uncharacterized Zn finger protein
MKCPYCGKTDCIDEKLKMKGMWLLHCRDCNKWFPLEMAHATKNGNK